MPPLRDFLMGPWRAVAVIGVTQILAWGALFYPPVLTVPLIAADRGWSQAFAMAGFSVGLFSGGVVSRYVGALIDRFGGHVVMPFGSLIGALGLVGFLAAPLHAFALPRERAERTAPAQAVASKPAGVLPPRGLAFALVATAFASYAFVPSALSAQLLAIFQRFGLSPTVVVAIG